MRLALSGKSGVIVGTDYRGESVLAAHEPIAELGWGAVAKLDMAEIREPFIRAGMLAGSGAVALILLGTILVFRISNPVVRRLEENERMIATLLGNLPGMAYRCKSDRNWTMEFVSEGCRDLTGYSPDALVGNREISYGDVIHPDDREDVWMQIQEALDKHEPFQLFYRIRTAEGGQKWVCERGSGVFSPSGRLLALEGLVDDITERKRVEDQVRERTEELEVRIKELNCLFGMADLVQESGGSLESILQGTADIVASSWQFPDITRARITMEGKEFRSPDFTESVWKQTREITVHGDQIGSVEVFYIEERPQRYEGPFLREERKLLNAVAERLGRIIELIRAEEALEEEHRQVISMFDSMDEVVYVADPDTYELLYMNGPAKEQFGDGIGQRCYYVLQNFDSPCSFCTNNRIFGENTGKPYIWEFQNMVNRHWYRCIDRAIQWPDGRTVRFEMAIDITGRRLAEEQVKSLSSKVLEAQELERKLVAQEIHDSIGASLAAIKYGLERKMAEIGEEPPSETRSLEQIIHTVQSTIEESRRISINLRPSLLDDLGLLPTISWFCRDFQKIYSDIQLERDIDMKEQDVPEDLKIIVFRILQEALNNVARHSGASHVRVSLRKADGDIELSVEDNGQGFDPEQIRDTKSQTGGLGLLGMRERAELSGGVFNIKSDKGSGTRIAASWSAT